MLRFAKPLLRSVQCIRRGGIVIRSESTSVDKADKTHKSAAATSAEARDVQENVTGIGALTARQPLVKNFFVGIVDKELLGFPEVINREDMSNLQNDVLPLKNYFEQELHNNNNIEKTQVIPAAVLDNMQQLGLYGLNVPIDHDGKGYNYSSSLIASQPETNCTSIALSLVSHRSTIDFLREVGTEQQKQIYLKRLASGNLVATEAIYEYNAPEDEFFNTTATYSEETGKWTLCGEKAFVVTGPLPKDAKLLFLVIAQTRHTHLSGETGRCTTIFLVDSDKAGVQLGEPHITFGCKGTQSRRVTFDNVQLSEDNIMGMKNDGNKYAEMLTRSGRLRYSLLGITLAKNLLNELTEFSVQSQQCGTALKDMELIRVHLSKTMCSIYAMESMLYLTAGMLDEFQGQDVSLEAVISKYYVLRNLCEISTQSLSVIGPKSLHAGQFTEINFRNATQLYTQGESIDMLRMCIALTGLQHAGQYMNDVVRKARNPLFHPNYIFSKFFETTSIESPKTNMRLSDNLHPSLEPAAKCIELSVARLQMSVELMFTRHGSAVVERHNEMNRLADISATLYAMFASAARASRSYCIGLSLADHELLLATAICLNGRDLIKTLSTELFNGHYVNNDNNLLRLAPQIAKSKGYFAVHPLTFNF